jgi:ABC-2 type transport system permease protein
LTVPEFIVGLILVNFLKAIAGLVVASLVAWLFYAFDLFPLLPALLPQLGILLLFALAVGLIVTVLILRYSTRIQNLSWSVTGLLMPFSCVFYPVESLPRPLRFIAVCLPTTHAFEGMRRTLEGGEIQTGHLVAGYVLATAYLAVAALICTRLFHGALARGILVKLE